MSQRMFVIGLVGVVATAVVLAAACGGDDDSTSSSSTQGKTPAGAATVRVTAAHTEHAAEIDQQALQFIPAKVTVKVGETVLIKNSETAIHTGNVNGKNITGNMKKGDSTPWTAPAAGTYSVTCDYHPAMKATIEVAP